MLVVWSIKMDIHPRIIPKKTNINIKLLPHFLRGGSFCYPGWVGGVYRGWTWCMDWTGGALHLQLFLLDHDDQQQNDHQRLHGQHDRRPQGSYFWAWVDSRGRSFAMTIVCSCLWPSWPALLGTTLSLCTQSS